ncbi:MAG: RNA polymerase factor sigma-54 [Burkholderiales bacterium]|nr:RNA polymerase factor sigma-54 [Burkholderiales bacterium]
MKQTLQLKLSQHLTLTPQLQQSIRLLQLSTLELNQELERFLAENPLLEREESEEGDESPVVPLNGAPTPVHQSTEDSGGAPDEPPAYDESRPGDVDWFLEGIPGGGGTHEDADDGEYPQLAAEAPSLREHLLGQLSLTTLPDRDRSLVAALVDALDEDGYLSQPLEEIAALFPAEAGVEIDELAIALRHLQNFDPTGVGARGPEECLALQLEALPEATPGRDHALRMARDHLALLAARDFARLRKLLHCDDAALRTAQKLIQSLNPRPGSAYGPLETRYVIADVILRKVKNVWVAMLNPAAMPKLRINRIYADILQANRSASGSQLAAQLQEARWLIKNVQQRFETIQRVSQAIVDRQRHFFEHGEVAMRPLVLREIAEALGLHESTVSRVTTQKFMATPRGIFELKYFFGSHVATDTGGACSATAIRALIKQLVAAEDARKPLSDSKISEVLGQQGIVVARRTIAKYRESLQIPPVNLRKSL